MALHQFDFEGGRDLTSMGATWFVSYAYYDHVDRTHDNWKKYTHQASVYERTHRYHKGWLERILEMNPKNLAKNTIGLTPEQTMEMAREVLKRL